MALYVLRYFKDHNIAVDKDISLYCGTCEEQGMFDLDYFTENYPCPSLSLVPDADVYKRQHGRLPPLQNIPRKLLNL